jgi:hypothetical protein
MITKNPHRIAAGKSKEPRNFDHIEGALDKCDVCLHSAYRDACTLCGFEIDLGPLVDAWYAARLWLWPFEKLALFVKRGAEVEMKDAGMKKWSLARFFSFDDSLLYPYGDTIGSNWQLCRIPAATDHEQWVKENCEFEPKEENPCIFPEMPRICETCKHEGSECSDCEEDSDSDQWQPKEENPGENGSEQEPRRVMVAPAILRLETGRLIVSGKLFKSLDDATENIPKLYNSKIELAEWPAKAEIINGELWYIVPKGEE